MGHTPPRSLVTEGPPGPDPPLPGAGRKEECDICGIIGFIGRSKHPEASFELANALLAKTESRGEHATGFYGCERGGGTIFYDKEPVKSSIYINRSIWKDDFGSAETDLLIAHCRFSSAGVGHERFNKNNHPHVSVDRRTALVHNGRVPEYSDLKNQYATLGDCDSEILLRMFESGEDFREREEDLRKEFPNEAPAFAYRMMGMKEIFSQVNYGAMAVAVAERGDDGTRSLWLFRNDERPLTVIDLRKTLGQIFFCSTDVIWKASIDSCPIANKLVPAAQRVVDFPSNHVWNIAIRPGEQEDEFTIRKFKVNKKKSWVDQKPATRPAARPVTARDDTVTSGVVTRLGANDDIVEEDDQDAGDGLPAATETKVIVAETLADEDEKKK